MNGTIETLKQSADGDFNIIGGEQARPLRDCVRDAMRRYFSDLNGHSANGIYQMVLTEVEQPLLESVMEYAAGNQSRAATLLGISRSTLRKKLARYGLD